MDNFEVKEILETFQIIADTREHDTEDARKRYKSFGVPVVRGTLDFGDYAGQITLPSGELYDLSNRIRPRCVIERKMSLDELAGNFTRGRQRFEREFSRASDAGAKVFLLVEGATWEALLNHRYRSRFTVNAYFASITAWMVRYGVTPVFCKAQTSAKVIREILYRDMKERLENGEFG
jgi:ERCC4-type nuclease